jgi:preprotein translocase subunit SecY
MIILFLSDWITEKGITNGTSLIIFASIISGVVTQLFSSFSATHGVSGFISMFLFI